MNEKCVPEGPGPFPTLISFYPYRKDDIIGSFSAYAQRWFAQRGYAHLLVDVRGSGGSSGRWVESMDPIAEGRDGAEVVEWTAAQEWCDGSVGRPKPRSVKAQILKHPQTAGRVKNA